MITFDTHPDRYRHWKLQVEGAVATLVLDVAEDGGIKPGYKLKLNSYDLGVDIELHDALQPHPLRASRGARASCSTSGKERMFCSGANIYMLGHVDARLEGEFLQVHQRDAQRHRGLEPPLRPEVPGRA